MIEEQVRQHLLEQDLLKQYMATYADTMAIFFQEAPDDTDEFWGKGSQYGRIVFYIDMQDDPQRNISGTLSINLFCENGTEQIPEEIAPILKSLIDGYFFSNDKVTMAAQWSGTQLFSEPTKKVIGATLIFALMDFPNQETTEPDPIRLINDWTFKELPQILIFPLSV